MIRRLAVAAILFAASAAPFAPPASATICEGRTVAGVSAGVCDEDDYWVWCAGASVQKVGGVGFCQWENRTGVWMGCWTAGGLRCN